MYEFHYDQIKSQYDNKSNLLITDTNSLINEIKIEDVYKDFSSEDDYYDDSSKLVMEK